MQYAPGKTVVRPGGNQVNRSPVAQILVERVFISGERTVAPFLKLLLTVSPNANDSATYAWSLVREAKAKIESCQGVGNVVFDAEVFHSISGIEWMKGDGCRDLAEDAV